jgi:hypothetical protein
MLSRRRIGFLCMNKVHEVTYVSTVRKNSKYRAIKSLVKLTLPTTRKMHSARKCEGRCCRKET